MHLYNAWLPPPVAQETKKEAESFAQVVRTVKQLYRPDDPDSVYSTLKWISVLELFIKAKSEVSLEDVVAIVDIGLELFHKSQNKLYAQVRWGNLLVRILNEYRKKLSLKVMWRPLYDTLVRTHFTRSTGPEGWRLRQRHFETITSLVRSCRRFFPPGSAFEIWSEFKSLLENPWHNASFEGSGFVRLFLPTNMDNQDFFSVEWIKECLENWDAIPNCQFWNSQWSAVIARVVKNYRFIDWEQFLPSLYAKFLNMFEVPVANGSGSNPFSVDVPRNTRFLFPNKSSTPAKAIAKATVYLLKPDSSAQTYFEKMINLLEQYYHPSNGGRWTYSLERFLVHLVLAFQKRLQREQQNLDNRNVALGKLERVAFVNAVLKLVDRGQYSKNEQLSETVAAATAMLSYVEPSLVLPFLATRFHMALETMTATHQLKSAVMSVAFAGRALFFTALSSSHELDDSSVADSFLDLLVISLSNALLGMDANDPPKTLATMQLIGSIFSNIATLEETTDSSFTSMIRLSEWLDEFLIRLFTLLLHLEPHSVLNEGLHSSATSGTFLVEDGPYYYCMLEILLGKLSKPLYNQALKKISKFVRTNILPGAIAEVGLLCCACVHSNPEESVASLVQPILSSVISSLKGSPTTGYGGTGTFTTSVSTKEKPTISPALEASIDYQLKILSVAISYGGPALLHCKDQFKEAILSAFESPSWKVNGAGDHLLRALFGSLILYYPIDQYKCALRHPNAADLETWISTKGYSDDQSVTAPKWHIPSNEEVQFANELLTLHFQSALDDILKICQTKLHSDPGNEKEHLKVTLLRIDSSLQGALSCLPDFSPSFRNGMVPDPGFVPFFIAGATGSKVGSTGMREKAAEIIHTACRYLLEKKSDDSILLILLIRIMDALGNYGSMEYSEWSNHRQAWKMESAAIIEPSVNFIVSSHSEGKKRPRWALIDRAYMHNTWRSSQSSYHLYRSSGNFSPSEHLTHLVDDLLDLAIHSYETVRGIAGKSLLKMIKRWPCMISKCVLRLATNLSDSAAPENAVLGSCAVLSSQTVLKHLTVDPKSFSAFVIGILSSSRHESLKSQKAINELFVKFNIHFGGVSKNFFRTSDDTDAPNFSELVSQIGSMSFDSTGLHWRYNLMANRVLLLLAMASRNYHASSSKILNETAGHFLKNLKSQLPQTRILAISALNILLKESPHRLSDEDGPRVVEALQESVESSLGGALTLIIQEEGFFHETFSSLANVHIITDTDGSSGKHGNSSFQSVADKSITRFYFEFSSSWPRTPSWISLLGSDTFYSNFARIFKRLLQECGTPLLLAVRSSLEEFANAEERSKQCVAAEAFAGVLHSDVDGLEEAWDSWMMAQLQNIVLSQSVESIPEWATCIRYAVTGKGKNGARVPLLRQRILECLATPLPLSATTTVVAKRYAFLSAALIELTPHRMPVAEMDLQKKLLNELLDNMCHSSAQVREAIGVTISVLYSNIRLYASSSQDRGEDIDAYGQNWVELLSRRASELVIQIQSSAHSDLLEESSTTSNSNGLVTGGGLKDDIKWMETLFHFVISSLKSGRSSYLLDVLVELLHPVISLQETSNKDLSTLAKAAFELLKWRIFWEPHLEKVVQVILSLVTDSNWRTRSATLTYLRTFMYRHIFILSASEKQQIWEAVGGLLVDSQVEVREHAAAVLAGLMKGVDENLASKFRDDALAEATSILKRRKRNVKSSGQSVVASLHGAVLALAASVLSVPYDMPSWLPEHVTVLARFAGEASPVKSTVTKAVAEFRRTHADMWNVQKESFTEDQLEVLADTTSSSSYFA